MTLKPAIEGGEPVREDFLVYGSPFIGDEEIKEVTDTLRSGWLGLGPKTKRFEDELASFSL
jgi:dTDP-4-amino-4,6-dideoxygalactose transaminase